MENLLQMVLTLAVVVVAVCGIVALLYLSAIRKSLEALAANQGRVPIQPAPSEEAPKRATPVEAPPQPAPVYRPVIVSPPPSQPTRVEEAPQATAPASRPMIVSPPPPPAAPVHQTMFEEPLEPPALEEEPAPAPPATPSAEISPPTLPAEPERSQMPFIIGIVVLVVAIGFLVFVVWYTK